MLSSVRKVSLIEGETPNGRQRRRELDVLFGKSPFPPATPMLSVYAYVFIFQRFGSPGEGVLCLHGLVFACVRVSKPD